MENKRYYFVDESDTVHLDFSNLGFDYVPCPYCEPEKYRKRVQRILEERS